MGRRALVLLLGLTIAVLSVSSLGCGGDSSGAQKSAYSNSEYGFSLEYQKPLAEASSSVDAKALGVDFATGFVDPDSGGLQDGTFAGLVIAVRGSDSEQPSASVAALAKSAWWLEAERKAKKLGNFDLVAKKALNLNGAPAFLYEGEGTLAGRRFHFKNVAIFAGNRLYELVGQWPTTAADAAGSAIGKAIDAFTLSDDVRAMAIETGKAAQSSGAKSRPYSNGRYRFKLTLPAGFQTLKADELPNSGQAAFSVGFADSESAAQASSGQLFTIFLVQVGPLGQTLDKAQAARLIELMANSSSTRRQTEQGFSAMYDDMKMSEFELTTLGARPALRFDVSYTSAQATRQRQRVYILVSGKYLYQLQLEASQSDWRGRIGALEKMARSFRIR